MDQQWTPPFKVGENSCGGNGFVFLFEFHVISFFIRDDLTGKEVRRGLLGRLGLFYKA
jgi:hypothetical protein